MTAPRDPYEPWFDMETGAERHNASEMAGKLGEYAREREAALISAFWWSVLALVVITILQAVFA